VSVTYDVVRRLLARFDFSGKGRTSRPPIFRNSSRTKRRERKPVRDFARTMQQAAIPSLTCIIGASEALIGPFAVPDFTACGNCARLRLYANAGWSDHAEAEGRDAEHLNATAGAIFDVHLAREVCDAICLGRDGSPLVNHGNPRPRAVLLPGRACVGLRFPSRRA
jgi:hypothetical protein